MGLWGKSMVRDIRGSVRKEGDRTNLIDEFFANQRDVVRYEVVDNKEYLVNVDGSIHLYEDNLTDGELFFKIGHLTGNLYCHGKHLKQSVVPDKLDGEIVFVPDEEEQRKNRQASDKTSDDSLGGMEMLTTNVPTKSSVIQKISDLITTAIKHGYEIDIENIKENLSKEWENRDNYNIRLKFTPIKSDYLTSGDHYDCDIFVDNTKPIKISAVQKSLYLAFIMMEEGVLLSDITTDFINTARQIYSKMSGKSLKPNQGLMSDEYFMSNNLVQTINGDRKKIRTAIEERVSNSKIVDELAVEGYKCQPVFVKRATPELREQIRQTFGLE